MDWRVSIYSVLYAVIIVSYAGLCFSSSSMKLLPSRPIDRQGLPSGWYRHFHLSRQFRGDVWSEYPPPPTVDFLDRDYHYISVAIHILR